MNINNNIFKAKTGFFVVLVFLFFTSPVAYGYPVTSEKNIDINTFDVLNTFDIQNLIDDTLNRTLESTMPLSKISSFLPLGNNPTIKSNIFNLKELSFDNAGSMVKSVVILVFQLLLVALTSITEILKVFVNLITSSF